MAKAKGNVTAAAAAGGKVINRKKRNALERKSLPKNFKALFKGDTHATYRSLLKAWQESRKKVAHDKSSD